ncbi:flagellar FlbD family protein [Lacrimispora saccharolytica]|uniref:Flagellar FlbD family protein n=1 Tax=Lacrimispora saccharolytica (strain ATCC 35040 / DSM 2544 / NRCC 2533 / WM1) TaxID=610130 RepID=D9RA14_LACSW|nr:flagellar FlbD family protein [Lacrimispora saccharolytica]ADL05986.1 flagellar FlbD family protein [[Clostridium] saccharolyticum WM1]QRV19885.1 flagellar FlbD family protein [Lacrimispora saccharolytica]
MIRLTRLNDEEFVINCGQIERVESIPESNIILVSGKHYVVKESIDEIINRVIEYNARIYACAQRMKV